MNNVIHEIDFRVKKWLIHPVIIASMGVYEEGVYEEGVYE